MMPPFSGIDLVRVMRAEWEDEYRKAQRHLPFESAEDFEEKQRATDESLRNIRGWRRLVQFAISSPGRTNT